MAYFDQDFTSPKRRFRDVIGCVFDTPFDRRSRLISARAAELRALSDAELAALGIPRDQIILHVLGAMKG